MSLSRESAIALAREIKAEEPDLMIVRPIPVDDGWLIVVKCGLWRWRVSSKAELEAGMRIIFGDPHGGFKTTTTTAEESDRKPTDADTLEKF